MAYLDKTRVRNDGQKPIGYFNRMGFTLVETMIALAVVGVVLAGAYRVYLNFNDHAVATEDVSSMQQNVRVSIEQITRELRSAGYRFGAPVTGILGSVSDEKILMDENNQTNQVTIQGDFDDNGVVEKVTYAISCTETPCQHPWLMRKYDDGMGLPPAPQFEPFAENITNVLFRFYGTVLPANVEGAVNVLTAPGDSPVKRVYVELTGRTDSPDPKVTTNGGYRYRTVSSDVVLRNFNAPNGDTDPPLCPTTDTVSEIVGECGQLNVTWTLPTPSDDIAGLRIYYSTDLIDKIPPTPPTPGPTADYGSMDVLCSPVCPTSATLTGLNSALTYNVIVESFDAFGNVSKCFPGAADPPGAQASVSATPDAGVAPMAPAGLNAPVAEMSVSQATIHWAPVTLTVNNTPEPSLQGYRVYRGTDPDFIPDDTPDTGNLLADEKTVTFTSFLDKTVVACNVYYYKVKAVNTCGQVSAASAALKVSPPDNEKAPLAPTITQLVAGDDTSTLIMDWKVPAPVDPTANSTPVLLKVYYKEKTSTTWLQHSAVDLTVMTLPATGQVIFNGLTANTVYDVKLSAIDAAGECGDFTESIVSSISTAACAPKIQWTTGTGIVRGGHFIFPGTAATGTKIDYLSGRTVVGSDPDAASDPDFIPNSRYITWVVDPLDCTPDSSNFDRQGFDFSDPPSYVTPSFGAKVDFFINRAGDPTNTPADTAYGDGNASDPAPRSNDYYHFPFNPPSAIHMDTGRLCSGDYDFRIRAVDGEQYTAENTISLTVMTGGVTVNSAYVTRTKISTGDDYHHIVELELMNTHPDKDIKITQMKLNWNNFEAYLKKVERVVSPVEVLYEDTTLPIIDIASGSTITFSNSPTVTKNGGKAIFRLTFTTVNGAIDATVDMRGKQFTSDITSRSFFVTEDALDATFVCKNAFPNTTISPGPQIAVNATFLDQPALNTIPSILPVTNKNVAAGKTVGLSTAATDTTGNPVYSVTSAKIFYAVDAFTGSIPPSRPSFPGASSSYVNTVPLTLGTVSGENGFWTGGIPPLLSAGRVWYYLEVTDSNGNYDILPEVGAYTYAQCDATPPILAIQNPTTLPAGQISSTVDVTNDIQVVALSSTTGIQDVIFTVTGRLGVPLTTMAELFPGSGIYTGSYTVPAQPDPPIDLSHTLTITATDQCGNTTKVTRNYS